MCLKESTDPLDLIAKGNEFYKLGAHKEKALDPHLDNGDHIREKQIHLHL